MFNNRVDLFKILILKINAFKYILIGNQPSFLLDLIHLILKKITIYFVFILVTQLIKIN